MEIVMEKERPHHTMLNIAPPAWINKELEKTQLMIDATTGHEALPFIDRLSKYNKIRMSQEDKDLVEFRNPKGIYCYKIMSFGLKNNGAIYRKAM
ncbi:hypothetical protein CDL12_21834 [Handroanthus impetiginosus]|uniref:Uncharacterized protein n=1 Tax=Handroanthus impetiginosus TaxID=429701 RepID=A0A2G9GK03_9LAMI|nr:hypothetical protein CDL12_21834 [Handroanthus impetiginosus]